MHNEVEENKNMHGEIQWDKWIDPNFSREKIMLT